jgi:hypothetical protein
VAIYSHAFNEAQARLQFLAARVLPAAFKITAISVDAAARDVSLTWEASAGVS